MAGSLSSLMQRPVPGPWCPGLGTWPITGRLLAHHPHSSVSQSQVPSQSQFRRFQFPITNLSCMITKKWEVFNASVMLVEIPYRISPEAKIYLKSTTIGRRPITVDFLERIRHSRFEGNFVGREGTEQPEKLPKNREWRILSSKSVPTKGS